MKRLLLILMLGIAASTNAVAQHYFNVRDPLHSFETIITSVVSKNNFYYCTSVAWDSSNMSGSTVYNVWGVNFAIYDSTGKRVRDTIFQMPRVKNIQAWFSSSLFATADTGFILGLYVDDTSGNERLMIIQYDTIGNVLWTKEYDQPFCTTYMKWYTIEDFKPTGDGCWLAVGIVECKPYTYQEADIVLTKLDKNFNVIWSKKYGDDALNDVPSRVVIDSDGYIIAGGRDNSNQVNKGYNYRAELIKTDTAGNQQWIWLSDSAKIINKAMDVVRTEDKGYIYCGGGAGYEDKSGVVGVLYFNGWVEKLDSNRNVEWNDTVGTLYGNEFSNQAVLKKISNGDIVMAGVICGGFHDTIGDTHYSNYNSLMRFNKNGDVIWEKKYKIPNDSFAFQVYDMKQTTDSGYILCGSAQDFKPIGHPPLLQGWLIKVDSNGCMSNNDPQCWPVNVTKPKLSENRIRVWPNPTKGEMTITTLDKGDFFLLNIEGERIADYKINFGANIISFPKNASPGFYIGKFISYDADKVEIIKITYQP